MCVQIHSCVSNASRGVGVLPVIITDFNSYPREDSFPKNIFFESLHYESLLGKTKKELEISQNKQYSDWRRKKENAQRAFDEQQFPQEDGQKLGGHDRELNGSSY